MRQSFLRRHVEAAVAAVVAVGLVGSFVTIALVVGVLFHLPLAMRVTEHLLSGLDISNLRYVP